MTNRKSRSKKLQHNQYKARKARKRDYKAEYARRIQKATELGISKTRARGHRSASDAIFEPNRSKPIKDRYFNVAFKEYEKTKSFRRAAQKIGVSPERFRNQAFARKLIAQEGNRWKIIQGYPKILPIYSGGHQLYIEVGSFKTASKIGRYMNAVRYFLRTQKTKSLKRFSGKFVTDTKDNIYVFETDENTLYRIAGSTSEPVEFYDHS